MQAQNPAVASEMIQARGFVKRRRYLVDRKLQLALALPLLAILLVIGLAYVAVIYLIPGQAPLHPMTAGEMRGLFLRANLIYYALAASCLLVTAIVLSHRIAGPAQVIERALRGMLRGDYEQRLSLRPSDYLQTLASAAAELREHLREEEAEQRLALFELATRLERGDAVGARELLALLELNPAHGAAPATAARS